jgi:hypothetical protein
MSIAAEHYPVVNYDPAHYIPLSVFQNQWDTFKEEGSEQVEDPYGRNPQASSFAAGLNACAPFVIIVAMMVILINTMGVRAVNPEAGLGVYLSSPTMLLALVAFTVSLVTVFRKVKFAVALKDSADFAVLESARRYLTQRYEVLPENWEIRFINYLVGEEVAENRFSEEYQLTVKPYKGHNVIMVANINGEAPVKN